MEDFRNSQQGILVGLPNETVLQLKQCQQNWNNDFLSGSETNAFSQSFDKNFVSTVNNYSKQDVGTNLSTAISGLTNVSQLINSVVTPKLVTYVTSYVTNIVMSYMQESITDILSIDPSKIVSTATEHMPKFIEKPADILKKVLTPKEVILANNEKEFLAKLQNQINEKISNEVIKISSKIKEKLEPINHEVSIIATYATLGPGWISNKLDNLTSDVCESSFSYIGKARDYCKNHIQNMIDNIALKYAEKLADKVNQEVEENTKKIQEEIENKKQEAITKAKTSSIDTILNVASILGF